ncbi:signal peptidase I [Actinokineospora cianjurensis]|uniref:Signal peptidase I n=1 Tax=Actinokineospora cianjurensis TaxID=585224 RepID=A0A421B490_9PSEU|nr:signal peptidase I [Actinokineospora cianjurensis]RLK59197.1 signal peptidase I [Actinokineospora cianjurensis]
MPEDAKVRPRWPRAVAVTLCVVVVLAAAVAGLGYALSMRVDGRSMAPTLADGEQVLTNPFGGDYTPERLDVVVLSPPGRDAPVVKRVIGVPGDHVRMTDGRVLVQPGGSGPWLEVVTGANDPWGRPPRECCETSGRGGVDAEVTVPTGQYWVVGDNPAVSEDSREYGWVPADRIRARLWLHLWPPAPVDTEPRLRPV